MPIYKDTSKIENLWLGTSKVKNIWLGTDKIYSSSKTLGTWTQIDSLPSVSSMWMTSMTYGNGKFVATFSNSSTYPWFTSTDGINWSSYTPSFSGETYIKYIPEQNMWYAIPYRWGSRIRFSSDLINWSYVSTSDMGIVGDVCGDSRYVYILDNYGGKLTVLDSTNYTVSQSTISVSGFSPLTITCSTGNASRTILIHGHNGSNENTNIYLASTDGVNWTTQTHDYAIMSKYSSYINGKFFISPFGGGYMYVSTDGITWYWVYSGNQSGRVAYGGGWYLVGDSGGYMKSTDGYNWYYASGQPWGVGETVSNGTDIFVRNTASKTYYMQLT